MCILSVIISSFIIITASTQLELEDSYFKNVLKQLTREQSFGDIKLPILTSTVAVKEKPDYNGVHYSFDAIMNKLNKTMEDFWDNDLTDTGYTNKTAEEIDDYDSFALEENVLENDTEVNFSDMQMSVSDFDNNTEDNGHMNDKLSDEYFNFENDTEVDFSDMQMNGSVKINVLNALYLLLLQACM